MALSCVIMGAADWELVSKRGSVILHGSCHHWIKTILRMVFATATREIFLCFYNTTTLLRNYRYIDNFIFQYELSTFWSDLVVWAGLSPLVQSRLDSDRPARASWSLTQPLETLESEAASQTTELVAAILTESCFTPAVVTDKHCQTSFSEGLESPPASVSSTQASRACWQCEWVLLTHDAMKC